MFVVFGDGDGTGDWRWGIQVQVPPLYASLPCLLQVHPYINKESMEIRCPQSRPLLGAICPTWNGRCRGLVSEAAMGTDPEMADWRGRATGALTVAEWRNRRNTYPAICGWNFSDASIWDKVKLCSILSHSLKKAYTQALFFSLRQTNIRSPILLLLQNDISYTVTTSIRTMAKDSEAGMLTLRACDDAAAILTIASSRCAAHPN